MMQQAEPKFSLNIIGNNNRTPEGAKTSLQGAQNEVLSVR
jgi:hypothetical protein